MSASLTADQILSISRPAILFGTDPEQARREYRSLMSRWHPDRGAEHATQVTAHINELYKNYRPDRSQTVSVTKAGRRFRLEYLYIVQLAASTLYVAKNHIIQITEHADLDSRQHTTYRMFKFANNDMRAEHRRYLPTVADRYDNKATRYTGLPGFFPLSAIKRKYPNLAPEHVAWILSSLYNVNCYLKYAGITYGGLTLDSYFVHPQEHSGVLMGGWLHSCPVGQKPLLVPSELAGLGDYDTKAFDSACIRKIGRDLLGSNLHIAPMPMQHWLKRPGRTDSYKEYADYKEMLLKCFGTPRYVELNFTYLDL